MYWKNATSASRRDCHDFRQISAALIVLKKVSTADLSKQFPLSDIDT
jgi:hypothetical protein